MKKIVSAILLPLFTVQFAGAQTDKTQLSLAISKAYTTNLEQIKQHVWKRKTEVYVDGSLALTLISDFSFDANGALQVKVVDSKSSMETKGGPIKQSMAKNKAEEMKDYWGNALELVAKYMFMSKGDMVDFFDKATVTENSNEVLASAKNVYVKNDQLDLTVDKTSLMYKSQSIKTFIGADAVNCGVTYKKLSNGLNAADVMTLELPAQKMKVVATNYDYAKKL
jgi:hypothetical protein